MTRPVVRWAPTGLTGRRRAVAAPQADERMGSIDAVPPQLDLHLYAGDDFHLAVTVTDAAGQPVDLSTAVATAEVRLNSQDDPALAAFAITTNVNVLSLHLAGADSALLPPICMWDCQVALPEVVTLLRGQITMVADVSRPEDQVIPL